MKSPQEIVPLLVLCLPLASLGARVENRLRSFQGRDYHDLLEAIESAGDVAGTLGRSVRKAVLRQSAVFMGLHLCASLFIGGLVWLFGIRLGLWPGQAVLDAGSELWPVASRWGLLWTIAAVGGLLALRIRWAQASFVAGVTALAVLWVV